jgi:nitroreductase
VTVPAAEKEPVKLHDLVLKNRSTRRFDEHVRVSETELRDLVELARLSPSAGNKQPLKFMFSCAPELNARVFARLGWAAYLVGWGAPPVGERPVAYIIILGDTSLSHSFGCDHGIAAQSMMLGAAERGLGGCIIGSIDRDGLRQDLGILPQFEILLVLAIGKPKEMVVVEPVKEGNIRYWRDAQGGHHVPKRALDDLIIHPPGPRTAS